MDLPNQIPKLAVVHSLGVAVASFTETWVFLVEPLTFTRFEGDFFNTTRPWKSDF